MASSSEFSIEDWKRHLKSGAASRQLHPRELLALDKAVAAADQARRDQPSLKPRQILNDVAGSTGCVKALLRAKDGTADPVHSPSRLSGHARTGLGSIEAQHMLFRHSQQQSVYAPLHSPLKQQQQQLPDAQHQQQPMLQQQPHGSPGHQQRARLKRSQHIVAGPDQQHTVVSVVAGGPPIAPAADEPAWPEMQQHVPAARRALVDQRQKWQRISDWTSRDSAEAAVASSRSRSKATAATTTAHAHTSGIDSGLDSGADDGCPGEVDTIASVAMDDLRYSLEPAMMELELARNRVSTPQQTRQQLQPQQLQSPQLSRHSTHSIEPQHSGPYEQQQLQQQAAVEHSNQFSKLPGGGAAPAAVPAHSSSTQQLYSTARLSAGGYQLSAQAELPAATSIGQQRMSAGGYQLSGQPEASAATSFGQPAVQSVLAPPQPVQTMGLQQQLQQEQQHRQQDQQLLQQQQRLVSELQQQVQQLLQQQQTASTQHRDQMQQVRVAAERELEDAKQVLEQERQQLRAAAMDVAEFRAQQQALVQQEQQKRHALHQQLQQAAQQLQQAQEQLEEMQQLKEEVQSLREQKEAVLHQAEQQHLAETQQLSERLTEAVNQKQELQLKVTVQLADLQKQLEEGRAAAVKAAADNASLTAQLAAAERVKGDLEAKLEVAEAEVAQMRDAVSMMGKRLEAREKTVTAQLQEFQQQQLSVQQQELLDAHSALDAATASANSMRDALLAVHSALSPHSLSAALGFKEKGKDPGFSLGAEGYEALTGRLLAAKLVTAADAEAIAGRVRELLSQVHMLALNYERAEAAVKSDAHAAVEQLQQELNRLNAAKQETEQRLSAAGEALEAATMEIEQLTAALQDVELLPQLARQQQLVVEHEQAVVAVTVAETGLSPSALQQLQRELDTCKQELQYCRLQLQQADEQRTDALAALKASEQQLQQAQQRIQNSETEVHQMQQKLGSSQASAEAKDERIKELRAALGDLMESKQVHEATMSKELQAAHRAMAASQQQLQQEQHEQASAREQMEQECRSLRQQLDKARADASLTRGAAEQAQGMLRKMLVQVQAASEEAVSTCREQSQQQLRQSGSQSQSLQLQLCWNLHQQLAQELMRLPRMDSAPVEGMEAAMPVMVQLPQLTVTALLAVTEQHQAEQASLQAALRELVSTVSSVHSTMSAVPHSNSQQHASPLPFPTGTSFTAAAAAAKQQLQDCVQLLHAAVAEAAASATKQQVESAHVAQQLQKSQCELQLAAAAKAATEKELYDLRMKVAAKQEEVERLRSELHVAVGSAQRDQGDLSSQLAVARQAALQAQQQAETALKEAKQAAAQASEQAAQQLAAREQQSAEQLSAMQQLVQQLQQQLQDAVGQVMERSATVVQLQDRVQQLAGSQQQFEQVRSAADAGQVELRTIKAQNQLLALQAGVRLRQSKRAARLLKLVRARCSNTSQSLLALKAVHKQQQLQLAEQQQRIQQGTGRLRKLQHERDDVQTKLAAAELKLASVEARLARAEGLVPRLEERCSGLGLEKKKLQEKVSALTSEVSSLEDKVKAAQSYTATAQHQNEASRKELEQLKGKLSAHEQREQQLLSHLASAEAGMRGSRVTSSRLLQEGQRLELQVQRAAEELATLRQQLEKSSSNLQQAQQQIAVLHGSLLQKTAVADAAQCQMAAAALTQQLQDMLHAAAPAAVLSAATAERLQACESLAAALTAPSTLLLSHLHADADPKVKRIQELRAALATALSDVASAASAASTPLTTPKGQAGSIAAADTRPASAAGQATAQRLSLGSSAAQGSLGAEFDPKLQRIQELTVALTSAAAELAVPLPSAGYGGSNGGANSSITAAAAAADADADPKQHRIQELRSALAEALKDKDKLLERLVAAGAVQGSENETTAAGQQLIATKQQAAAATQEVHQLQQQLTVAHAELLQLQQQLQSAQRDLASEQQQHTQLKQEHAVHDQQLTELQQQHSQLQQMHAEQTEQVQQLQQHLQDAEREHAVQSQQVLQLQRQLSDAQQQLVDSDQQLQLLEELESAWLEEKTMMDHKVTQLQMAIVTLQNPQHQQQEPQNGAAGTDARTDSSSAIGNQRVAELEVQLQKERAAAQTLRVQLEQMRAGCAADVLDVSSQQQEASAAAAGSSTCSSASGCSPPAGSPAADKVTAQTAEALQQELTAAQVQLAQALLQQSEAREQLAAVTIELQSAQQQLQQKEQTLQQQLALSHNNDSTQLSEHEQAAHAAHASRQQLEEQQEVMASLRLQLEHVQQQLVDSDKESQVLQELLDSKHHELQKHKAAAADELAAAREAAAVAAAEASHALQDAADELQQLQQQLAEKETKFKQLQLQHGDLTKQLDTAKASAAAAQAEADKLRQLLLEADERAAAAVTANTEAHTADAQQLAHAVSLNMELKQQLQQVEHKLEHLQKQVHQLQASETAAKADLAQERSALQILQCELAVSKAAAEDAAAARDAAFGSIQELQQKLTLAAAETRTMGADAEQLRAQVQSAAGEIARLQQQLAAEISQASEQQVLLTDVRRQLEEKSKQLEEAKLRSVQQLEQLQLQFDASRQEVVQLQNQQQQADEDLVQLQQQLEMQAGSRQHSITEIVAAGSPAAAVPTAAAAATVSPVRPNSAGSISMLTRQLSARAQSAEEQLQQQQQANQRLRQQLAQAERQMEEAQLQCQAAREEAAAVSAVAEGQWAARVQQLQDQLHQALQEHANAKSELAQVPGLKARLATLQQQLTAAEEARAAAKQAVLDNGHKSTQMQRRMEALQKELELQKQLVQSLQATNSALEQQLQQQAPASGVEGAAPETMAPDESRPMAATLAVAGQNDEIASIAEELASSKKQLQGALDAAAEMQQQARELRLQLYSRRVSEQEAIAAAQHAPNSSAESPVANACDRASKAAGLLLSGTAAARPARGAAVTASKEAMLAAENRDLVLRLTATHRKLKLLRSRSQQREAMQDAKLCQLKQQVESLSRSNSKMVSPLVSAEDHLDLAALREAATAAAQGSMLEAGTMLQHMEIADQANLQAEMEAYKRALHAAQEEAAAAMAAAAEARAQADALNTAMQSQAKREATRRQASQRLLRSDGFGSPSNIKAEDSFEEPAPATEDDDIAALVTRLQAQHEQIKRLTTDLDAANLKRAELAKANSTLTQQLADHDRLIRALREQTSDMAAKLTAAEEILATKDALIEQLKSLCSGADLASIGLEQHGSPGLSGASTPSPQLPFGRSSSSGCSPSKRSLSRQSSKGLVATQHGVGKVVSAWKETGKLKDLKIEELNFQLGQAAAQLELARNEAAELQHQLAGSQAEVSASAIALAAAQKHTAEQLKALESQLASKESGLAAAEVQQQALEAELNSANSKAASLQKQLDLAESEVKRLQEAAALAASRLSTCQAELAAARQEAAGGRHAADAARHELAHACDAAASERQQLNQLEGQVAKLAAVLRQLLISVCTASSSPAILEPYKSGTPPVQVLSELVDLVAAELSRKMHDVAAATARISELESRVAGRSEELAQLQGTLKAQSDKIFAQQSALGKAQEELRVLRSHLESRTAQQDVIEAEIRRQVEEHGRLKRQLVNQEELQAALAAKTNQLAASAARCGALEVQLAHTVEQGQANSQRLAALKVAADGAARAHAEAAVQRQEALASLEVARAELDKVQQQLAVAQAAAEKKGQEVRELNHMLKAWEAMRLGKDAQIAALMERCKRNEEDAAEKARTVDALRRKLALAGRPGSAGSTVGSIGLAGANISAGGSAIGSINPMLGMSLQGSAMQGMNTSGVLGTGSSGVYSGGSVGGAAAGGMSALRRSWAAETGSPVRSPTRSVGSSYCCN